ncbi:MAG: PqqD family protein [Methylococcales bacterium]
MEQLPTDNATPDLNTSVFKRLALSDSGFVFDPVTGKSYTVNETGFWLIRQLQQDNNLDTLYKEIVREFDGETKIIERNVIEFLEQIRRHIF